MYNNNVYIVQYQYTTYYSLFSLLLHVNKVSVTFMSEIVGNNTRTISDNTEIETLCIQYAYNLSLLAEYSWQFYLEKFQKQNNISKMLTRMLCYCCCEIKISLLHIFEMTFKLLLQKVMKIRNCGQQNMHFKIKLHTPTNSTSRHPIYLLGVKVRNMKMDLKLEALGVGSGNDH